MRLRLLQSERARSNAPKKRGTRGVSRRDGSRRCTLRIRSRARRSQDRAGRRVHRTREDSATGRPVPRDARYLGNRCRAWPTPARAEGQHERCPVTPQRALRTPRSKCRRTARQARRSRRNRSPARGRTRAPARPRGRSTQDTRGGPRRFDRSQRSPPHAAHPRGVPHARRSSALRRGCGQCQPDSLGEPGERRSTVGSERRREGCWGLEVGKSSAWCSKGWGCGRRDGATRGRARRATRNSRNEVTICSRGAGCSVNRT